MLSTPKRSKKQKSRKDTRPKKAYKNHDKDRGRKVVVWIIPLIFAISLAGAVYFHSSLAIWCTVASAVVLLAYALFLLEWYVWHERRQRLLARVSCLVIGAALIGAGFFWQSRQLTPTPRRPWLRLTDDEKRKFIAALASQSEPREIIRLGCPAVNEDICVRATPFVDAFKRGHFIVENDAIGRMVQTKPSAGVVIGRWGHADAFDPQDPDQGKWTQITDSLLTVEQAFLEIGINANVQVDETLPKNVTLVYFSIEPDEPTPPDVFNRRLEELRRLEREKKGNFHPVAK
jgi:hypothetical protein